MMSEEEAKNDVVDLQSDMVVETADKKELHVVKSFKEEVMDDVAQQVSEEVKEEENGDVPQLKKLSVGGVITLKEPHETLMALSFVMLMG
ncbi:hypothetical protein RJT34_17190 [Clitoria ternatea]|uniref:Uncharacterized protein n=1 Tax=Clitoria ternatea TaxID=43366 RepID=A0AAN9PD06_CLITE